MSVLLVTHCYAMERPQYAVFLRAQLSSLVDQPRRVPFRISVCHAIEDVATVQVLEDLQPLLPELDRRPLPLTHLYPRAIGRNAEALRSREDLVWFTDCDYLFVFGCLEDLHRRWLNLARPTLLWPRRVLQTTKAHGDAYWREHQHARGRLPFPAFDEFQRYNRAIGGIQIVAGDYARAHGYLAGTKWVQPKPQVFGRCFDDVPFRRRILEAKLPARAIDLESTSRVCHTDHAHGPEVAPGAFDAARAKRRVLGGRWRLDEGLVPELRRLIGERPVCDFGAGIGRYCEALGCPGIDGIPGVAELSGGRVREGNLADPNLAVPPHQVAICLEVAEHVPRAKEGVLLDHLTRQADVVILSWAKPRQRGTGHINCRGTREVKALMQSRGFVRDELETRRLRNAATIHWLRKNVSVFRKSP